MANSLKPSKKGLPYVSVIICSFDNRDIISKPLAMLYKQSYPKELFEIIIVDDGSKFPITINEMQFPYLKIKLIRNKKNMGLGYSRNAGLLKAKGSLVLFTDNDCSPHNKWIEEMVDGFNNFPEASAMGGRIIAADSSNIWQFYTENAKIPFFEHMKFQKNTIYSYLRRFFSPEKKELKYGEELRSCMGLNSAYRKVIIDQYMPDPTKRRGVDLDINLRLIEGGYKIIYNDKAIVAHPHRKNFISFSKHAFNYGLNTSYTFKSNRKSILPYPFPILGICLSLLLIFISILTFNSSFFLLFLSPSPILIIIILYYLADLPYAIKMRKITNWRAIIIFPFAHFTREFFWDIGWIASHFWKF
ncbi:MAG: glycosyltransferase [Candidatus Hermodarchaeota archaeon]